MGAQVAAVCFSGRVALPRCTLAYAAPEVALAANSSTRIAMLPSQDIWALGVMVCPSKLRIARSAMILRAVYMQLVGLVALAPTLSTLMVVIVRF